MTKRPLFSYLALFLLVLSGCGSGAAETVPLSVPENKAIILSASLKPGLANTSATIKAIEVSFDLPAGASPVLHMDGSLQIGETGLKNLKILATQGNIASGSYNQGTRTVHFTLLPNNIITSDIGTGDIARLTYTTTSGTALAPQELEQLQQSLAFMVSGPGSVDISSEIVPSARIMTYQKP
jgi:hypothetical protein